MAMRGGARRQGKYNFPKKNHIRNNDKQARPSPHNTARRFHDGHSGCADAYVVMKRDRCGHHCPFMLHA